MRFWWTILPILVIIAVVAIGIHDFLSFNEPTGEGVLVMEGWIPEDALRQAAVTYQEGNYSGLVTTGTLRPFAHYLNNEQRLVLEVEDPKAMEFALSALTSAALLRPYGHPPESFFQAVPISHERERRQRFERSGDPEEGPNHVCRRHSHGARRSSRVG